MSSTTKVPPESAFKVSVKRTFDEMSKEDLIQELESRDKMIAQLRMEHTKLKKAATASSTKAMKSASGPAATTTMISPEKAAEKAGQLTKIAIRGIKSQMKWKPSCKYGTARWSFTAFCDEPTFRAFMRLEAKDKTKGGKVEIEKFEDLLGQGISTSIRYGYLQLRNETVNITYNKTAGEIKMTGAYGM